MSWVELVAAAATTASAIVIAWQAWLTRRSLKLAEQTLDETRLVRLDARAPRVFLSALDYPDTRTAEMRDFTFGGGSLETIPEGHRFTLPGHTNWEIRWSFPLTLMNDGPGSVVPEFATERAMWVDGEGALVPPREAREFHVSIALTVEEWIRAAETSRDPEAPETARLSVAVQGPDDSDVSDTWDISITGSLLDHPPGDRTGWAYLTEDFYGTLRVKTERRTRVYWRSRARGEKL
jgi:uncharacterized protein (DUF1778 family)